MTLPNHLGIILTISFLGVGGYNLRIELTKSNTWNKVRMYVCKLICNRETLFVSLGYYPFIINAYIAKMYARINVCMYASTYLCVCVCVINSTNYYHRARCVTTNLLFVFIHALYDENAAIAA